MNKLSIIIILSVLSLVGVQAQDTITVEVDKDVKVLIYAKTREGLKKLKNVDMNKILSDVVRDLPQEGENPSEPQNFSEEDDIKVYEYEYKPDTDSFTLVETTKEESLRKKTIIREKKATRKVRHFWAINTGINQYFENGSIPSTDKPYSLGRVFLSQIGFGAYQRYRIGGQKSPMSIQTGLEVNWHNFYFENNNYIFTTSSGVAFGDYQADFEQSLSRSKLTVAYFDIPLTLNFRFKNKKGRNIFGFGGGGYAGMRLGSHSKAKAGNDPNRNRGSFFLNNWRYGWEAHLNILESVIFFRYDLNTLFEENAGPELNVFSIGVRW